MDTFRITDRDIVGLSDIEFADVMSQLLLAEAARCALPAHYIQTSLNIKANDAGVDGRVAAPGIRGSQYCPDGPGVWQYKAEDATPTKLGKEARKGGVVAALRQGEYYRVAIARGYSDSSRRSRERALRDAAANMVGDVRPDATGILTATDIAAWASLYPAVLQLPYFDHPVGGLLTFADWARSPRHQKPFVALGSTTRRIGDIRAGLGDANGGDHVCVVGHASVGKTRLTLEALRGTMWEALCLYAPSPDVIPDDFFAWMRAHPRSVIALVVDQCAPRDIGALHDSAAPSDGRVRLVTIGADRTFPTARAVAVDTPDIAIEDMRRYAEQVAPFLPTAHKRFVAEMSGGYVGLASDLCDIAADDPTAISSLTALRGDERLDAIVRTLLPGDRQRRAMGALALLARVGLWDEVAGQGRALAAFAGVSLDDLRDTAREMEHRERVAIRGRYCVVTPPLLAVWLAWEVWRDRVDDIETTLLPSLSGEGRAALFDRLRGLGEHPSAARFVRDRMSAALSGARGAHPADVGPGVTLAVAAAALPPRETARTLERTLGGVPEEAWRSNTVGDLSRRDLVPLLARLAWHEEGFFIAAGLLRKLSDHETEPWANNATGVWEGLFRVHLGGTSVPFDRRLPLLDAVIGRSPASLRRPALGALREALGIMEVRDADAEDQGGRILAEEWRPASRAQDRSARLAALDMLDKLCEDVDADLARDAWSLLLDTARSLIKLELGDDVMRRLERVPRRTDEDAYRLRQCLQEILAWERDNLSDDQQDRLRALLTSLTGPTWFDRLRRWAGPRAFAEYDQDGDDLTAESPVPAATEALADQAVADPALLTDEVWTWLKSPAAANAGPFAERLGRKDAEGRWLSTVRDDVALRHNAPLLAGYLSGHAGVRGIDWYHDTLRRLADDFPDSADTIARMTLLGHASDEGARRVMGMVRQGTVDKRHLSGLAWGPWPDILPDDTYHDLVALADETVSADTVEGVLTLIAHRLRAHPEDRATLENLSWRLLERVDLVEKLPGALFAWTMVAEMYLPDNPVRLARILLGWAQSASLAVFTSTQARWLLSEATKAAPRDVWAIARPMIYSDDVLAHIHYAVRGWYITLFDLAEVLTAARAHGQAGLALTAWLCPMDADMLPPLARALLEQSDGVDRQHVGAVLQHALFADEEPTHIDWYERKWRSVERWVGDPALSVSEWARDVRQELMRRVEVVRRRDEERRA